MQQDISQSQSFIKKQSTIGSIFIFITCLFFYVAIKFMIIPLGLIAIPRSHESWMYLILG